MPFKNSGTCLVTIRFPWGELVRFESAVTRLADGSLSWLPDAHCSYEPGLDLILKETDTYVMGWLKGTCDTTVVVSQDERAPIP